jgi:hypothetical protein
MRLSVARGGQAPTRLLGHLPVETDPVPDLVRGARRARHRVIYLPNPTTGARGICHQIVVALGGLPGFQKWSGGAAVVSHLTALSVNDLGDVDPARAHLSVPAGFHRSTPGLVLHHPLPPEHHTNPRRRCGQLRTTGYVTARRRLGGTRTGCVAASRSAGCWCGWSTTTPAGGVLKGGTAVELRRPGLARSTTDLDLVINPGLVTDPADRQQLHEALVDALLTDPDGDGFVFSTALPSRLRDDSYGR